MTLELPALPGAWRWSRIGWVSEVSARIGWKALTAAEYVPEGYIFLSTPNIKSGDIDFDNVNFIPEWRYLESPELMLERGDVLLVKDGNTLGITNIVRDLPAPATVNGSIAILRPKSIEPRFLRYVLASDMSQGLIDSLRAGMGVPHLFQADIKKMPVPLPPLRAQSGIADFLDAETCRIDALIVKKRSMGELLGERVMACLDQLVVRHDLLVPLRRFAGVQGGVTVDSGRETTLPVRRLYLRVANVQDGYLDLSEVTEIEVPAEVAARSTLRRGDVLMTEANGNSLNLGRGTVWMDEVPDCLHQNHIFAIRTDQSQLLPEFLSLMTQSARGRGYFQLVSSQVGIATISKQKVLDFPVPHIPVSDQHRRVEIAMRRLQQIQAVSASLERQVRLLGEHRQALITAAVTGDLEVPGMAA